MSHGSAHLLDGLDFSKVQISVEPSTGNSATAINDNAAEATTNTVVNAVNAANNAADSSKCTDELGKATLIKNVAAADSSESADELEKASLISNIAAAHQANAVYASLLAGGLLQPMSHLRDLLAYMGIVMFEHRAYPLHQLAAEAQAAHEAYSHVFPPNMVPPVDVLAAAKKEMMEEGAVSVQLEDTAAVREWGAAQPALEDGEDFEGLEREVVIGRLKSVLQECLEMLNKAEARDKKKKRAKSKRNRKNKKAGKQVAVAGGAGEEEAREEAREEAGVADEVLQMHA